MTPPAYLAVARFGLGARPGELDIAARDPQGWVAAQLNGGAEIPARLARFGDGATRAGELAMRFGRDPAGVARLLQREHRTAYLDEASARVLVHVETDRPFHEHLVQFWSNHFTVSVQRPAVLALAGPFEREAIRPHVGGRFRDMLLASSRHPAMLLYLDQAVSMGPNSRAGLRTGRGLNENLAREILELHTLGVDGGYTQGDVTEFARILTGWAIARDNAEGAPGRFLYRPNLHEPGAKTLLGRRFGENGEREGIAALEMLAAHPSTARFVATKLARHFIADDPPPAAVERLARIFRETDGDLAQLHGALVELPGAWNPTLAKVKTPHEFVVAALRVTGYAGEPRRLLQTLQLLGQGSFAAPSPAGWPDTAEHWIGPDSVMRRAEWAASFAQRLGKREPDDVMRVALGPAARDETRRWAERAASATDAVALVFASPEFQRR